MARVTADKYYGKAAADYERARCHTQRWSIEQMAVADFVVEGPVLDVPLGTGRYVSSYLDKGLDVVGLDVSPDMIAIAKAKHPHLDVRHGSIFEMPFEDQQFGTAVCTRLLDWLSPGQMQAAVAEIRRVAREVVVTVRHGPAGCRVNYTHPLASFYRLIEGLYIAERRVTEETQDGVEEIFKMRAPVWADVLEQFTFDAASVGRDVEAEINRIAGVWEKGINLGPETTGISAEYWTGARLVAVIEQMSQEWDHKVSHDRSRYVTAEKPRVECWPVTILRTGDREIVLDGRRRINQITPGLFEESGLYPVLAVECPPSP